MPSSLIGTVCGSALAALADLAKALAGSALLKASSENMSNCSAISVPSQGRIVAVQTRWDTQINRVGAHIVRNLHEHLRPRGYKSNCHHR
jgi:hypothetical protein